MKRLTLKKAIYINMIAKYSNTVANLVFSIILARILAPSDYGVIAIVTVFSLFFLVLADMSIGSAVVQNKELTKDDNNSIFTFCIVLGVVMMAIFCALAYPISLFYRNDAYLVVVPILSTSILFSALNVVPNAMLMKDKKFLRVGIRTVTITIVTYLIAVVIALNGGKYYTFVVQTVLATLFTFIWNYMGTGLRIVKIRKESIDKIKHFFIFQFAYEIINYISKNIDNVLLGRVVSKRQIGFYDKGYRLMIYPINNLTYAVTPGLHSMLSDFQKNKEYIYNQYKKIVKILSILGMYITVAGFFCSREVILIMLGDKWEPAVECFKILSISVWAQLVASSTTAIYMSLGRTKTMFKSGLIHISITVALIAYGAFRRDIYIVAICVTIGMFVKFLVESYFLIAKTFEMSLFRFFKLFVVDWVTGGVLVALFVGIGFIPMNNIVVSAIVKVGASLLLYFGILVATKQIKYIVIMLPGAFQKRLPRFLRKHVEEK